jgi:hypothetical protein
MIRRTLLPLAIALTFAVPAAAQSSYGIRAGVSGDPDQFVFGGHFETHELMDDLTFRPNAEIGVGDHLTTVAINLEFASWIPLDNQSWRLYLGGGPAVNVWSFDSGHRGRGNDSNVGGGFNVMVGVQHDGGLFTEVKVGAIDSPSVKWVVGYVFD